MRYWRVTVGWHPKDGGEMGVDRTFIDEEQARAFIEHGDPCAGFRPVPASWEPLDKSQISWKVTECNLAVQSWICSLNRTPEPRRKHLADEALFRQTLRLVLDYFMGVCDHALAFDWNGARIEGALTPELHERLRSGIRVIEQSEAPESEWLGIQLYRDERTLFHLDDGSDNYFVVDEAVLKDLLQLGLQAWQLHPEHPGDTLRRAGPDWTGG